MESQAQKQLVAKLLALALAMFIFAVWGLPPLYTLMCDVLNINTRTANEAYLAETVTIDESRSVEVKFVAINNEGMRWEFRPNDKSITAVPGKTMETSFYAMNPSAETMIGQAIPSVLPPAAAQYFHKTECFCFNQQRLAGGKAVNMPLRFIVDSKLPKDIQTITLTYSLFDTTDKPGAVITDAPDKSPINKELL